MKAQATHTLQHRQTGPVERREMKSKMLGWRTGASVSDGADDERCGAVCLLGKMKFNSADGEISAMAL